MTVEPITTDNIRTIEGWCIGHGKSTFPPGWLPPTGFWVPGVLAGFVYKTDADVAYLENIVSNPDTTKQQRREALLAVSEHAIEHLRQEGFRYLLGLTAIQSVAEAAKLQQYKVSENKYAILTKLL